MMIQELPKHAQQAACSLNLALNGVLVVALFFNSGFVSERRAWL